MVVSEGLQLLLPLAGLFDVEKELQRLDRQKQKVGVIAGRETRQDKGGVGWSVMGRGVHWGL